MNPIVVLDHEGKRLFGFDAELFKKMKGKRDGAWERSILVLHTLRIKHSFALNIFKMIELQISTWRKKKT